MSSLELCKFKRRHGAMSSLHWYNVTLFMLTATLHSVHITDGDGEDRQGALGCGCNITTSL